MMRLSCRLREDNGGSGRRRGKETDCSSLPHNSLRHQLHVLQITITKDFDHDFAAVVFGGLVKKLVGMVRSNLFEKVAMRFMQRFRIGLQLAYLLWQFPNVPGDKPGRFGQSSKIPSCRGKRAISANKLHAPAVLHLFRLAQQDSADLTGTHDMGATAGSQIEVANIN